MLGLSPCNETNWEEEEGKERAGVHAVHQGVLAAACEAEHNTREKERETGKEFGLQWAKERKKGLLVIIKSSHTDFLPNLFPQG